MDAKLHLDEIVDGVGEHADPLRARVDFLLAENTRLRIPTRRIDVHGQQRNAAGLRPTGDVAQTVPDHPGLVPGIHVFMVETSNKKTWPEVPSHDVSR
jgi:hypothetical protein